MNITGAFLLGLFFTILVHRFDVPLWLQSAVLIGLLGGYTTFSTLSLELFLMMERSQVTLALVYAAGSVVAGVASLYVGILVARAAS